METKTMKIETREDALLHTIDLWLWLAVTGNRFKGQWPGWEDRGGYLGDCLHDCPVCHFTAIGNFRTKCKKCPIKWSKNKCWLFGGEFKRWESGATIETRKKWALEIAILALEAL